MEELRAVLFDLDGVLVDSREAWFRVVNAAARAFRKPDIDRVRFDAGWGQGIDADVRDFFPGCKQRDVERFYEEHLLDFPEHVTADADARTTLVRLRDAHVPRGVVTNTPTFLARDILAWVGLVGLVDVSVGAGRDVRPKPEPDMLRAACDLLQVEPRHTLFVGDSPFDLAAAQAAGTRFLGLRMRATESAESLAEVLRYFGTVLR